jgi:hypothetical protein
MTEGNLSFNLHIESAKDLTSYLTEFAQMQRVVGHHDKAEQAEMIRNTLYAQNCETL